MIDAKCTRITVEKLLKENRSDCKIDRMRVEGRSQVRLRRSTPCINSPHQALSRNPVTVAPIRQGAAVSASDPARVGDTK